MTATHLSKSFLASLPPLSDGQADANDHDAAAAAFSWFERTVNGGTSGLLAVVRHIVKYGNVPEGVVIVNPEPGE